MTLAPPPSNGDAPVSGIPPVGQAIADAVESAMPPLWAVAAVAALALILRPWRR